VLFRDHALMRYHGIPNWPPAWLWIDGPENKHPRGEIGILQAVEVSNIPPAHRCFLCIDYEAIQTRNRRMSICHDVMTRMMRPGDLVLNESRNGDGPTILIRYSLKAKHDN
jgi:hypothetical protein